MGPQYTLATTGDDGWARVWHWNQTSNQFVQQAEYPLATDAGSDGNRLPGRTVCFSPDGKRLLAAGVGGLARVWNLNSSDPPSVYDTVGIGEFTCGVFSPDGQWVALGSDDKRARMWRLASNGERGSAPVVFEGHADRIDDIAIVQDSSNELRVMTASRDKSARVWDPNFASTDRRAREIVTLRKHSLGVTAIDATDDGELIMTAGRDGNVILWPASPADDATSATRE